MSLRNLAKKFRIPFQIIAQNYPEPTTAIELMQKTGWGKQRVGMTLKQWPSYFEKTRVQGALYSLNNDKTWDGSKIDLQIYKTLAAARAPLTLAEIMERTGLSRDQVREALKRHTSDLMVSRGGKTVYRLTPSGEAAFRAMGLIE